VTEVGASWQYNGSTGCPTSFPCALTMSGAFNRSLWSSVG
jgi:hypothetical protein